MLLIFIQTSAWAQHKKTLVLKTSYTMAKETSYLFPKQRFFHVIDGDLSAYRPHSPPAAAVG